MCLDSRSPNISTSPKNPPFPSFSWLSPHSPQISMTEIKQGIFCTFFQNFKIQLFLLLKGGN